MIWVEPKKLWSRTLLPSPMPIKLKTTTIGRDEYPILIGYLYHLDKDFTQASPFLEEAIGHLQQYLDTSTDVSLQEHAAVNYLLYTYYEASEQYPSALVHLSKYTDYADSLHHNDMEVMLRDVEQEFENAELQNEYRAYRKLTLYRGVVGLLCAALAIFFLVRIVRKRKQKILNLQADLEGMKSQKNEFDDLKATLSSVLDKKHEKEERLHQVLTNKMLHVQKILDYLFLYDNNPDEFKRKVDTAIIQVEKDSYFGELHEIVNEKYAGVIDYLKQKFPDLSQEELNLCCLICFGFNNNQMGILFGLVRKLYVHSKEKGATAITATP